MSGLFSNIGLMSLWEFGLAAAVGLVVLLIVRAVAELFRRIDPVDRRIKEVSGETGRGKAEQAKPDVRRLVTGLIRRLGKKKPRRGEKDQHSWEKSKLRADLQRAGYRSSEAVAIFSIIRLLSGGGLCAAALAVGLMTKQPPPILGLMVVGGLGLGLLIPNYFLGKAAATRAKKIVRELPNVLDLLVIAVEAGLGLDAAFRRVSAELTVSCPILAEEMTLLTLELQLGVSREEGLRNMARRCGADEVSSLAAMLIQADKFGVSVGRSLRVYSDEVRTKRRQQMEEAAAKIPLKLLFPVLFLIFPAIMAVMAGPALVGIMDSMF